MKIYKNILSILFILFVVSCGASLNERKVEYTINKNNSSISKTVPVYIDIGFSDEDKINIDNSLLAWNHCLNGYIKYNVESYTFDMAPDDIVAAHNNGGLLILKVNSSNDMIPINKIPGTRTIAWANISSRDKIYVVRDIITTADVFPVMLHEIGHILGANHTKEKTLMYPVYSKETYLCIDYSTSKQIADFHGFKLENMNYCSN